MPNRGHLTVASRLNAILWLLASLPRGRPDWVVGSIFATVIFIAATFVALVASLMLCGAFSTPVIDAIIAACGRD